MNRSRMERFAYRVESLEDLEPRVAAALAARLGPDEKVRMIVVAPRQSRLGRRGARRLRRGALLPWMLTPAWVLVLTTRGLIIATLGQPPAEPLVTFIATDALAWIEIGSVLLVGWLECAWVEGEQMQHMRVHFNTVGERHFRQIVFGLCGQVSSGAPNQSDTYAHNLSALKHIPFKFKSITTTFLLLPGERVQSVAYQPAIWRDHYGRFRRQQAAAKALILTNMHLLVVQDERSSAEIGHGFIARYYPLSRLSGVEVQSEEGGLVVSVRAALGETSDSQVLPFEPTARPELDALLAAWSPQEMQPAWRREKRETPHCDHSCRTRA